VGLEFSILSTIVYCNCPKRSVAHAVKNYDFWKKQVCATIIYFVWTLRLQVEVSHDGSAL